jgi:hypothetical protein
MVTTIAAITALVTALGFAVPRIINAIRNRTDKAPDKKV